MRGTWVIASVIGIIHFVKKTTSKLSKVNSSASRITSAHENIRRHKPISQYHTTDKTDKRGSLGVFSQRPWVIVIEFGFRSNETREQVRRGLLTSLPPYAKKETLR